MTGDERQRRWRERRKATILALEDEALPSGRGLWMEMFEASQEALRPMLERRKEA